MEKNAIGKAQGKHEKVITQTVKNAIFECSADLSSQMDILIAKNTKQITRNSQYLNIQEPPQIQEDEMS